MSFVRTFAFEEDAELRAQPLHLPEVNLAVEIIHANLDALKVHIANELQKDEYYEQTRAFLQEKLDRTITDVRKLDDTLHATPIFWDNAALFLDICRSSDWLFWASHGFMQTHDQESRRTRLDLEMNFLDTIKCAIQAIARIWSPSEREWAEVWYTDTEAASDDRNDRNDRDDRDDRDE